MTLTIAQILKVGFPAALAELRRDREWVSLELTTLRRDGRLKVKPLGAIVQTRSLDGTLRNYQVDEVLIPLVWSQRDEENPLEHHKINLAHSLITNSISSHDDVLLERIGKGSAIASKEYRYWLGDVERHGKGEDDPHTFYSCKIHTAVAFLPDMGKLLPEL